MTPSRGLYERRRYKRLHMATGDCRLTLIRRWSGEREREVCTLMDLSYAGLCFRSRRSLGVGEVVEFLIDLHSPVKRSGLALARIRWTRRLGIDDYEAGAEYSEESKGLLIGTEDTAPTPLRTTRSKDGNW
jgi:hypothetical protein